MLVSFGVVRNDSQRAGLSDVAVFENRQTVTAAKFITKSSLLILLLGVIRRLELKLISELKVENIFVAPPYCQTACWLLAFYRRNGFVIFLQNLLNPLRFFVVT
jgi:hypothetical protein